MRIILQELFRIQEWLFMNHEKLGLSEVEVEDASEPYRSVDVAN